MNIKRINTKIINQNGGITKKHQKWVKNFCQQSLIRLIELSPIIFLFLIHLSDCANNQTDGIISRQADTERVAG